jgi:uncharacterized protein YndB with AHSA1/START domain
VVRPGLSAVDTAKAERRSVSVTMVLSAAPETIFALLTDVNRHRELDGSGMLQGAPVGPDRLQLGSEFSMAMRQGRRRYRSHSRVVEFEQDRRIAWETTGRWRGHRYVGGQRWRYVLVPVDGGTQVTQSYVWGYAMLPMLTVWLPRFPARMERAMPQSLRLLEQATTQPR